MVPAVASCVTKTKISGVANAGDFSAPPPKAPTIQTAVKSSESEPPSAPEKPSRLVNISGTGFVISTSGHVLTNNHVIKGCVGDAHGNLTGEPATNLRLVLQDETNDLALLQASGTFKEPAHSAQQRSAQAMASLQLAIHSTVCSRPISRSRQA